MINLDKKILIYKVFLAAAISELAVGIFSIASADDGTFNIPNPITSNTFADLVKNIAGLMLKIGIPVATIFLIYSGFLFVSARGNDTKLKEAKTVFWYTIIGTAIIVGAYAIASAVVNFAQQL